MAINIQSAGLSPLGSVPKEHTKEDIKKGKKTNMPYRIYTGYFIWLAADTINTYKCYYLTEMYI